MKNLIGVLLILFISGCAVNNSNEEIEKKQNEENKVVKNLNIEKILKKNNEVEIIIKTKESKNCSIFLNKRVIDLKKLVNKEFIKVIKLKEKEKIEDILINCN